MGLDTTAVVATPTRKQRVTWVDIAKGMTIVLVVLLHTSDMLAGHGLVAQPWETINNLLQPIRMPLFFVASGLFAQGILKSSWPKMLRSRAAHLFYLYALWTMIFYVVHSLLPAETRNDGYASVDSLIYGAIIPNSALWFIYGLAVFAVVAKLIKDVHLVGQFAIAIALNVTAQYVVFVNFGWNNLAEYFVYFLIGLHFRDIVITVSNHNSNRRLLQSLALYAAASGIYGVANDHGGQGFKIAVTTSGLVLGVLVASRLAGTWLGNVFNYIGKNTIGIYLMFDIMIALVTYGLLQIPNLAAVPAMMYLTPLLVVPTVVVLALGAKKALVAAGQNWLFELPPRLRGTACVSH